MKLLIPFKQISKNDLYLVGGKGASLGELFNIGIPIPDGFVITTDTYKQFQNKDFSQKARNTISKAFDALGTLRVAVRSSAIAEDSSSASWAGQLESYLHVTKTELIDKIKACWESIRKKSAIEYARENDIDNEQLAIAVVVQKMVNSDSSGVLFTVNPITKDKEQIMIEACFGLGELLVQGMVTPDNYVVNKKTLEITNVETSNQEKMMVYKDKKTVIINVPFERKKESKLTDNQIILFSRLGIKIENHFKSPQDIELALENNKLYILQSRPITTI